MALFHVNYFSQALQKQTGMYVVMPNCAGPYRVIYQLHGLSDDYTIWLRRTSIERYADRYGLMIVMPDGGRAFYTDTRGNLGNYEQHILETVRFVDGAFRTIDGPQGRGIGGLSMGGYGAMKLGLKYPELFGSIASHSGALDMGTAMLNDPSPELRAIFGEQMDPGDDCFALASTPGPKPAIRFDCGVDDFLLEHNRRFQAHLTALGIPHIYEEYPGAHTWEYWDEHVPTALEFHLAHLAAPATA